MATKKRRKLKFSKFEKFVYTLAVLLLVMLPVAIVFSQATLSKVSMQVELMKKDITTQSKKNESLSMKINELASLDKIQTVAEDMGLSYINDNIKVISE